MFQAQMITQVLLWERRLEIEEEKRNNRRVKPDSYDMTTPKPAPKEHRSVLARIFRPAQKRQPGYQYQRECCGETQPG